MTTLKERLAGDVTAAMKAREKDRLAALRQIMAGVKQREIDEQVELDDPAVISLLTRMAKQRRESIEQFEAAGRDELAQKERFELDIIEAYLPRPLSDAELDELIDQAIAEARAGTGAEGMGAMGKVMGHLKPRVAGRADMGDVSARVKTRLGG